MVRGAGTLAVPLAADVPYAAREGGDNLFRALDAARLAVADRGDGGGRVAAEAGVAAGAALHLGRARAEVGRGGARAVGLPAAVAGAVGAAPRLGAALDVGAVGRARARHRGAVGCGAGGPGRAHACLAVGVAGLVGGCEGHRGREA